MVQSFPPKTHTEFVDLGWGASAGVARQYSGARAGIPKPGNSPRETRDDAEVGLGPARNS